jgi:hypothetical protein
MNKLFASIILSIFVFSLGCERVVRAKTFFQLAEATNGIQQIGHYVEIPEEKDVAIPLSLDQMFSLYPETKKLGIKKEEWIYEYKSGVGFRMRSLISFDGYYLERRFDGKVEKTKERPMDDGKIVDEPRMEAEQGVHGNTH